MVIPLNETDFLKRALAVYADSEAVVCGDQRLTYGELGQRVNRWAHMMSHLGLQKGDRVALLLQNDHRILDAFFGAPQLGAISMPLNFRLVTSDYEYILNHGEPKVLIVESGLESLIEPIRQKLTSIEHFILVREGSVAQDNEGDWLDYDSLLSEASPDPVPSIEVDENDVSALLYTSGTTGNPKGVMLTHRNLYLNAMNSIIEFGLQNTDTFMQNTAMFHCNGWGLPYAVVGMGAKYVVLKKFDPATVFELMAREQISLTCLAPTMIGMLLNHPQSLPDDLPRAMRVGTAGSAPPQALISALEERFGWQVIQVYGLTETSPFLTVSKLKPAMRDEKAEERYRVLTKSGYPMLGVELKVVDDRGEEVTPDGQQTGEVLARSNVVMAGYWQDPEATDQALDQGWFHTGDIATIDGDGYIELVDRKKDLIISGGENVSSIEVEGTLYKHPAVLEAAVIAVPDDQWGEAPKALVVLKTDAEATENDLVEFCRNNLAHYKCPKSVDFVDALPRTSTGKVQKVRLREKYWSEKSKRVQ